VNPLASFVPFLGFEAQGGDRAGFQPGEPDRLAGPLAPTLAPVIPPAPNAGNPNKEAAPFGAGSAGCQSSR